MNTPSEPRLIAEIARLDVAMRFEPIDPPRLGYAVANSILINLLVARDQIGKGKFPTKDGFAAVETWFRQLYAKVEFALTSAAEACGRKGLAAPVNDRAIQVLTGQIDRSWTQLDDICAKAYGIEFGKAEGWKNPSFPSYWTTMTHFREIARAINLLRVYGWLRTGYQHPTDIIDLKELVSDAEAAVRRIVKPQDPERVSVAWKDDGPLFVRGWPYGIYTAVYELIRNGIANCAENERAGIIISSTGSDVVVAAWDGGPGFKKVSQADSVRPFFAQVEVAPGMSFTCSLGLGLTVAKEAAFRSGGMFEFVGESGSERPAVGFALEKPRA